MTLIDVINQLGYLNNDDTIYAEKPWTPDSEVVIETEPDDGGVPDQAGKMNAEYFIEIFLAKEFLEGWLSSLDQKPSLKDQCSRLIKYAENDA